MEEATTMMGLSEDGVKDLITSGDLPAYGTKKDKLKTLEVISFMGTAAKLLNLSEAAIELDLPVEDVEDLIDDGELPAYGTKKNIIKLCDLNNHNKEIPVNFSINEDKALALQYVSALTDDITEEEEKALDSNYGEGSVYKNEKRGCYQAAFYITMPDGKRKRKIVSGQSELEAISKMQMAKKAANGTASTSELALFATACSNNSTASEPKPKELRTVAEVFNEFIESKKSCTQNTIKSYYYAGQDIVKYLGDRYIHEVTVKDIEDFLQKKASTKKNGKFSKSTLAIRRKTLSGMFKLASKYSYILKGTNPMQESIDMPESKETDRDSKFLTPKQVAQVLNCLSDHPRYKTMVKILMSTGLRIAELTALKWDDIQVKIEDGKKLNILHIHSAAKLNPDFIPNDPNHPRYIIGEPKTKSSIRDVPLTPKALNILNTWRETVQANKTLMKKIHDNKTEDLIFTNDDGKMINYQTLRYRYETYLNAAYKRSVQGTKSNTGKAKRGSDKIKFPFKVTFHMFRHSYASLLLEQGVELKVISEYLGHSSTDITSDIYTTVTDKLKLNTLPQIDNILDMCDIMAE